MIPRAAHAAALLVGAAGVMRAAWTAALGRAPRDAQAAGLLARATAPAALLVLAQIALAACRPAATPRVVTPPPATATTSADAGLVDMTPAPGVDVPSLDQLSARGAVDAPMMSEAKRVDDALAPTDLEAGASDTCFRAVIAASRPVKAWFADASNSVRGELADTAGLVPPRGPVCAKKGETLRLVVETTTPGTIARAVVWRSGP